METQKEIKTITKGFKIPVFATKQLDKLMDKYAFRGSRACFNHGVAMIKENEMKLKEKLKAENEPIYFEWVDSKKEKGAKYQRMTKEGKERCKSLRKEMIESGEYKKFNSVSSIQTFKSKIENSFLDGRLNSTSITFSCESADSGHKRFLSGLSKSIKFKRKDSPKNSVSYSLNYVNIIKDKDGKVIGIRYPFGVELRKSIAKKNPDYNVFKVRNKDSDYIPFDTIFESVNNPNATISRDIDGQYYFVVTGKIKIEVEKKDDSVIGIDRGQRVNMVVSSENGVKEYYIPNKKIQENEKRIVEIQKLQSKTKKGSNRYLKFADIISRLHKENKGIRDNAIHQNTNKITKEHSGKFINIETLNIQEMNKKTHVAKGSNSMSGYEVERQLIYKAERNVQEVRKIPQFYPSSKLCSCCGEKNKIGSSKVWVCKCGAIHDRDVNAAINIRVFSSEFVKKKEAKKINKARKSPKNVLTNP